MPAIITAVEPHSPAQRAGILPGDSLEAINGHGVRDVLDYKFYSYDARLDLALMRADESLRLSVEKPEGADLGLEFESYLMDSQKGCSNRCVFCFIDQLPRGMRPTLYFKDDDARLSFLIGNYISMTNLSDADCDRIINMRVSPLNISVHTTDPGLRSLMLGNRRGGESLKYLYRFADARIAINAQIVVCPGLNDGPALEKTLADLSALHPAVKSVAVVPLGLTRHRQGLYPLSPMDELSARGCIGVIDAARARNLATLGEPLCHAADELYLRAGLPLPDLEYYGGFDQMENGVGLMRLFQQEFQGALSLEEQLSPPRPVGVVCGTAAAGFLGGLIDTAAKKCDNFQCSVFPITNDFFGHTVDVSGLVTGGDIIGQLAGRVLPPRLLVPECMLRASAGEARRETVFLDDVTIADIEAALGVRLEAVPVDGGAFFDALFGL